MKRHTNKGFSLVETLVAMSAGLIVAMGVTVFSVALLRSNTATVQSTRVTQDLRVASELISRELRRSGFNQNAIGMVANQDTYDSQFDDLIWGETAEVTDPDACPATAAEASSCVLFAYDRLGVNDGNVAPNGQEMKGFRRVALADGRGVMQMFVGTAADEPSCADASDAAGWATLTPPGIDITGLALSNNVSDPIDLASIPGATVTVRRVGIDIAARIVGDQTIRRVCDEVRVRADEVTL